MKNLTAQLINSMGVADIKFCSNKKLYQQPGSTQKERVEHLLLIFRAFNNIQFFRL